MGRKKYNINYIELKHFVETKEVNTQVFTHFFITDNGVFEYIFDNVSAGLFNEIYYYESCVVRF